MIPQKTMLDTIPPEITFYEQDPESEMVTEYVTFRKQFHPVLFGWI